MDDRFRFRAWNKKLRKMVYSESGHDWYEKREFSPWLFVFAVGFSNYPTDGWEFMQCTGLPDRNNKLIFEGDILKVTSANHPDIDVKCIVRFGAYKHIDASKGYENGDLGFYLDWVEKKNQRLRNDILYWQGNGLVEVIGNICDNPELVNEADNGQD